MSLWIECSQVLLDLLFNANRVFELDDLWTNTLGAYLAYLGFQYLRARLLVKMGKCKIRTFQPLFKILLTKSEAGAIIASRHQKSRDFSHFQGACGDCEQAVVNLEMG